MFFIIIRLNILVWTRFAVTSVVVLKPMLVSVMVICRLVNKVVVDAASYSKFRQSLFDMYISWNFVLMILSWVQFKYILFLILICSKLGKLSIKLKFDIAELEKNIFFMSVLETTLKLGVISIFWQIITSRVHIHFLFWQA